MIKYRKGERRRLDEIDDKLAELRDEADILNEKLTTIAAITTPLLARKYSINSKALERTRRNCKHKNVKTVNCYSYSLESDISGDHAYSRKVCADCEVWL